MPFQPGNKLSKGRPPSEKAFASMLKIALTEKGETGNTKLREVADKLVSEALTGEGWAIREIADRTDGKAVQAIEGDFKHSADDTIMGLLERISANGKPIHG